MDVLSQVLLSAEAVEAWREACERATRAAQAAGLLGEEPPPDEVAEVADDGCLVIRGRLGAVEITLRVPDEHWTWAKGAVQ